MRGAWDHDGCFGRTLSRQRAGFGLRLLPELVSGAAVFASFAPYGSPGLDFCEGWPPEYRREVDQLWSQTIYTGCGSGEVRGVARERGGVRDDQHPPSRAGCSQG
jgi:hypothetical protein